MGILNQKTIHKTIFQPILFKKETFPKEFIDNVFLFKYLFPENSVVYEKMWKNMVQTDTKHMILYYGACALHAS
jgi:hypothetical protein